jgi:ABC-type Na+ efflux pump permease subunit
MNETLACRGCRHPLNSDAGCALCLSVKPHLTVISASEEENVSLAVVAQETVALLRKQLKHLKGKAKAGYNAEDAHEARSVANTLAKLLDSARKIVQDGADAVSAMSFQERAALFMEWTATLPSVYRRRLIDQLISQNQRKLDDVAIASGTQVQAEDGSTDVIN